MAELQISVDSAIAAIQDDDIPTVINFLTQTPPHISKFTNDDRFFFRIIEKNLDTVILLENYGMYISPQYVAQKINQHIKLVNYTISDGTYKPSNTRFLKWDVIIGKSLKLLLYLLSKQNNVETVVPTEVMKVYFQRLLSNNKNLLRGTINNIASKTAVRTLNSTSPLRQFLTNLVGPDNVAAIVEKSGFVLAGGSYNRKHTRKSRNHKRTRKMRTTVA